MALLTMDGQPFLAVNGVQTMSYRWLNLMSELEALKIAGVKRFRLAPHSCDMVSVAILFREVLDGTVSATAGKEALSALVPEATFANGFYHGKPGHLLA